MRRARAGIRQKNCLHASSRCSTTPASNVAEEKPGAVWTLVWGPVTNRDVLHIPWRTAGRLCAAVIRHAALGGGPVTRASHGDPRQLKLKVSGATALLNADPDTGVLLVTRMFPTRP